MKEMLRRCQAVESLPLWTLEMAWAGLFGSFRLLNYAKTKTCLNINFRLHFRLGACVDAQCSIISDNSAKCHHVVSSALQYLPDTVSTFHLSMEPKVHEIKIHLWSYVKCRNQFDTFFVHAFIKQENSECISYRFQLSEDIGGDTVIVGLLILSI